MREWLLLDTDCYVQASAPALIELDMDKCRIILSNLGSLENVDKVDNRTSLRDGIKASFFSRPRRFSGVMLL